MVGQRIQSCRPAPNLRQAVRYYYAFGGDYGAEVVTQPVPARSPPILEFSFGSTIRVQRLYNGKVESAPGATLVGPKTLRRVNLLLGGHIDAFTILFTPRGLFALFGIPTEVLTNEDFCADDVLGRAVMELHSRLAEAQSFEQRVGVADAFLSARAWSADSAGGMAYAATRIHGRRGAVIVADLADAVGLGARQFERRFRHEIGIAPKFYARIIRFEAALALKARAPRTSWTHIAHELGYYDQMHMVRDFKSLSGDSPSRISPRLDMFVRPEIDTSDV